MLDVAVIRQELDDITNVNEANFVIDYNENVHIGYVLVNAKVQNIKKKY